MTVYMTEEEQLQAFKKWWKRYGNLVTLVFSLILFCIAGFRYMTWHQDKMTQQASVTYEKMMYGMAHQNIKFMQAYANELIKDYDHSVYADVAHMTLAKIYVSKNKLDQAKAELEIVANKSNMTVLKQIAKIRIARIMAADKAYANALNELSVVDDATYLPIINELKGDILSATGKYQEAISAYRLALEQAKTNGMDNLFLEMKTNELAIKTQSMISEDKKVRTV